MQSVGRQKFMAFEGLLGWAAAAVTQAKRVTAASDNLSSEAHRRANSPVGQDHRESILRYRLANQSFQTERHLFCNAAHKLLEYRNWVQDLGFLDDALFEELDNFAHDIDVMRDMDEHVIEYFKGEGKRPHDWIHKDGGGSADASSTIDTKIGGRLDWEELGAAAQRLLEKLKPLGPFYPTPEETAADLKAIINETASTPSG